MGPFIMFRDLTVQLEAFGVFASPPPPPPPPSRPPLLRSQIPLVFLNGNGSSGSEPFVVRLEINRLRL